MTAPELTGTGGHVPAVAMIDADGVVTGWSRSAEDLFGYADADIVNRTAAVLLQPEGAAERLGDLLSRVAGREQWTSLAEVRHLDGTPVTVHLRGARVNPAPGRPRWLLWATPVAEAANSLLEPLVKRSPIGIGMFDRDLRYVWLNDTAARVPDFFPHRAVGSSVDDWPKDGIETLIAAARRLLADGVPVLDREIRRTTLDGREEHTFSISLFRLDGVDGEPVGVCSLAVDITHSRARQRLALLADASARIGTTLDVTKTAQEMAEFAVPALADYVTVDLAESVLPEGEPLQRLTATDVSIPVFRRAGAASIHPSFPESLWFQGEPVYVPPASPFTAVLSSGRSHFEPHLNTSAGTWLDLDPDRSKIIHDTRMHSLIIVPLRARGDVLGITVFVRTDNPAPFTEDDLTLAEQLAARAALSLDNARRYTREHNAALALQRSLLPRTLSGGDALAVAGRYLPSDMHNGVGGDWFDSILLPEGRIALVVGDVTGHGINAAATMGRLRTAVRTLAHMNLPPADLLTHLDRLVARMNEQDTANLLSPADMGATCLYVVYDPATRQFTLSAAGHPPPAVVTPGGEVSFPSVPVGTPIGLGFGSYEALTVDVAPGSVIALYTDGLVETRDADIDEGMARLSATLTDPALPLELLCSTVIDGMMGTRLAEDDIALLLARTL
ncbi:PAS domain S-box-containing protein [Nonomuraea maritima]|uniref:protein-serine/threonine phosphatase n=1 Tax=Nonomuraea maritima TaxID=683260 RepID=A0A1G9H961_9ACTN|nr:SpoIIE family protein phosphatase [Nonomuraea maritima]SDL08953.1 PAS domain S-box-containing protein [Nonomuraea maritima]